MSVDFRARAAGVALLFATLATAGPVAAQALSAGELRACATMALARPYRDPAQRADLDQVRARIVAEAAAIAAARPLVDRSRAGDVALFNDRVARVCADYAAYVAETARLATARNAVATAFNAACADRDFDPEVAAALPADLRAAWDAMIDGPPEQTVALSDLPALPLPMAR